MRQTLIFLLFAVIFTSGCASGRFLGAGNKKNNEAFLYEALVSSLFTASGHIPELITLEVHFIGKNKSVLTGRSKEDISGLARKLALYEDYEIRVKFYAEAGAVKGENPSKFFEKRFESIVKILTKNGLDRYKIGFDIHHIKDSNYKGDTVIEADVW